MLQITVKATKLWDEAREEFINVKETVLDLEHSLRSISKWESIWEKPFLSVEEKTTEETQSYILCMLVNRNVDSNVLYALSSSNIQDVERYISSSQTATWFGSRISQAQKASEEAVTSEIIYYWLIALNIPFECQNWHINRLLTLIKVCEMKNAPEKKMSFREQVAYNKALNEERRKKLNTKG